ncbi:MAG: hypothetical protein HQK87_01335 [Nitrospinae bacterium]|nr:hypothetical protein [Nitrospinota bacterium]
MAAADPLDTSLLEPDEVRFAKVLMGNNLLTREDFARFLTERRRFDTDGKRYLGDLLVDRGLIKSEDVEAFFRENNQRYLTFLDDLTEAAYLSRAQFREVMEDAESAVNVVNTLERRSIMTKANFIQLFSKRVNALRLGDWLLTHRKIDKATLEKTLNHQRVYRLEDWLVTEGLMGKEKVTAIQRKLGMA